MDDSREKQREANRRSYEKHKAERLAKRRLASAEQKEARKQYLKDWRKKHAAETKERDRQRWPERASESNARRRLQRQSMPKKDRSRMDAAIYYKKRYAITLEELDQMLVEQKGRCAICLQLQGERRLHIDHDHSCCSNKKGKLCGKCTRGLLCGTCNMIVGLVELDQQFTARLNAYLAKYQP